MEQEALITFIAQSLVDDPEAVQVSTKEYDYKSVLELRVADADVGRVIGKNGRIVKAMQTLLYATVSSNTPRRKRWQLEILS